MGLKAFSRLIKGAADYEEGSWTPTLGVVSGTDGTHTYGQQAGAYVRVGNLVWLTASVTLSGLDGAMSGNATIKGRPFVNELSGAGVGFVISAFASINIDTAGGYEFPTATLRAGASDVALREFGDNLGQANLTQTAFANNSSVVITGVYRTTPSGT